MSVIQELVYLITMLECKCFMKFWDKNFERIIAKVFECMEDVNYLCEWWKASRGSLHGHCLLLLEGIDEIRDAIFGPESERHQVARICLQIFFVLVMGTLHIFMRKPSNVPQSMLCWMKWMSKLWGIAGQKVFIWNWREILFM